MKKLDLNETVEISAILTKVIQQGPETTDALDTPEGRVASDLVWRTILTKLSAKKLKLTDVQLVVGPIDIIGELMKRNLELSSAVSKVWDDFRDMAHAKGYRSMKEISAVVGAPPSMISAWKKQNRVPIRYITKLTAAPSIVAEGTKPTKPEIPHKLQENRSFLRIWLKYGDLPKPSKHDRAKSNMTPTEMHNIATALFGDAAVAECLAALTGYSYTNIQRQLTGIRPINKNVADYLRTIYGRENAAA